MQEYLDALTRNPSTDKRRSAMNRHLTPLAAVFALAFAASILHADPVTWTGASNNTWQNGDAGNWDAQYDDGDAVIFNDTGANTNPIAISGTVAPGTMAFQNTTDRLYELRSGAVFGSGDLTKTGSGMVTIHTGGATVVDTSAYSGDIIINGGTVRSFINSTLDQVHNGTIGSGSILIDNGGTFQFRTASSAGGGNGFLLDNPITIGAGGGNIVLERPTNLRSTFRFDGKLTLEGPVTFSQTNADGYGATWVISNVQLDDHATITNNQAAGKQINIAKLQNSATHTLMLAGVSPINLPITSSTDLALKNLVVQSGAGTPWIGTQNPTGGNTSGVSTGIDLLAGIRANAGKVTLESGTNVQLGAGDWRMSDFVFNGNNSVFLNVGGQNNTAFFVAGITLGGSGNPAGLTYQTGQNNYIGVGNDVLHVADGGTFTANLGTSNVLRVRGNVRLSDGGTMVVNVRDSRRIERSTAGTLYLGDGNAASQERLTITGEITADNSPNTAEIRWGVNIVDDGNTILRYANTGAGGALRGFNLAWNNFGAFREGSAGTEFAPVAGTLGFGAVGGGTAGTVATFSNPTVLMTTGIVGFYNSTGTGDGSSRADLGPIEIANGGSFALQAAGVMQASSLTAISGSSLSGIGTFDVPTIAVGGTVAPGNSISILTMGTESTPTTVTFQDGGALVIEMQGSDTAGVDYDVLVVHGDVVFESGSLLALDFLGGYTPSVGSSWDIVRASNMTGLPFLTPFLPEKYTLSFSDGILTMAFIPEPSAGLLLGLAGLVALRRRR